MPELSAEQREARRLTIGSSEVGIIVGVNRWDSPADLYAEKVLGAPKRRAIDEDRAALGHAVEPVIAARFSAKTGIELVANHETFARPAAKWATATPDYMAPDRRTIVECKLVGARMVDEWGEGEEDVPASYRAQAVWQGIVCDAPTLYIAAILGGTDFRIYRLHPSAEEIVSTWKRVEAWYQRHVVNRQPPEPDGSEGASHLQRFRWPASTREELVEADAFASAYMLEIVEANEAIAAAEVRKATALQQLAELAGDARGVIDPEVGRARWVDFEEVEIKAHTRAARRGFQFYKATTKKGTKRK